MTYRNDWDTIVMYVVSAGFASCMHNAFCTLLKNWEEQAKTGFSLSLSLSPSTCREWVMMRSWTVFLAKQDMANPNSSEIHSLSSPASQIIKMVSGSTQQLNTSLVEICIFTKAVAVSIIHMREFHTSTHSKPVWSCFCSNEYKNNYSPIFRLACILPSCASKVSL